MSDAGRDKSRYLEEQFQAKKNAAEEEPSVSTRYLKVSSLAAPRGLIGTRLPHVRLTGKWLNRYGIKPGKLLKVTAEKRANRAESSVAATTVPVRLREALPVNV